MRIREFTPSDYHAVADIHNTIYPHLASIGEAWINRDRQRDPKYKFQRWVALEEERIVGYGLYSQQIFDYHPRKFHISISVLPQYRRRGIGSALYNQIIESCLTTAISSWCTTMSISGSVNSGSTNRTTHFKPGWLESRKRSENRGLPWR